MSNQTIVNCPKCGQQVDTDSRFCKHCAYDLSHPTQAPVSNTKSQNKQLFKVLGILGGLGLLAVLAFVGLVWYMVHKANDNRVVFESYSSTSSSNSVVGSGYELTETDMLQLMKAKNVRSRTGGWIDGDTIEIVRVGSFNQERKYWPVKIRYTINAMGGPVTYTRDVQILKNDYGDWEAWTF